MPEIIFKKRRGTVVDLFVVLLMYSISPSLNAILKSYRIKGEPYLYSSYDKICAFIDENAKELKPFFAKKDGSALDGSIFHKMTQMILTRDDLFMSDILEYFRKMGPEFFLTEIFRIMDGRPENTRRIYLKIVRDNKLTKEFLARHNCTVRETKAILNFCREMDFEYECFLDFLARLHKIVEREHRRNSEQIFRYTDWLQYRLNPKHHEFIFKNPDFTFKDMDRFEKIIVSVSLFPPYSCNMVDKGNVAVLCFGVGALMPQVQRYYKKQATMRDKPCEMRENVMKVLQSGPMRLLDVAKALGTSSPDINYHMGILEKNGFVKRVRGKERELFALTKVGEDFIKDNSLASGDKIEMSNG